MITQISRFRYIFLSATIARGYSERSMHVECSWQLETGSKPGTKAKLRCRFSATGRLAAVISRSRQLFQSLYRWPGLMIFCTTFDAHFHR